MSSVSSQAFADSTLLQISANEILATTTSNNQVDVKLVLDYLSSYTMRVGAEYYCMSQCATCGGGGGYLVIGVSQYLS